MQKLKDNLSGLLLFAIGIGWGHLWTMEILSCPEWWFIGINALLIGTGISLTRFMPESWRQTGPALLFCIVLLLDPSEIRSVILPLTFGLWYGGNLQMIRNWRISRNFCGGLMIGGILAGVFAANDLFAPALTVMMLLYGGLQHSWFCTLEMLLLSAFYMYCFTPAPQQSNSHWIDTGTVISAFGLVPDDENAPDRYPKIVFVGGNTDDHLRCANELNMVCDLLFLPELPGTVPPGSDVVIVCGMSENNRSMASLYRALRRNGVLVIPREYCHLLPQLQWHILPGSEGNFAVTSPGRELTLDPAAMDAQLTRHFRKAPQAAPVEGGLTGMLIDFRDEVITPDQPERKNFFSLLKYALGALCLLAIIRILHTKKQQGNTETFRILLNCTGYTMLVALLIPVTLLNMPSLFTANSLVTPAINSLIIISAVMWIYRRPVKHDRRNRYIGLLSLLGLIGAWFGNWIAALISLVSGGFFFAGLDGDLYSKRDCESEPVRFLGFAAGAFLVSMIQQTQWSIPLLFIAAASMRLWTWFRN